MNEVVLTTTSAEHTRSVAAKLAEVLRVGDLVVLSGDLGAGKTCFAQGIGRGLDVREQITSPTFAIHQQYQGRLLLHHLDAYRLDELSETLDLDIPDLLATGVTMIEWGERIAPVLPEDALTVQLSHRDGADDERRLVFSSNAAELWSDRLAQFSEASAC